MSNQKSGTDHPIEETEHGVRWLIDSQSPSHRNAPGARLESRKAYEGDRLCPCSQEAAARQSVRQGQLFGHPDAGEGIGAD